MMSREVIEVIGRVIMKVIVLVSGLGFAAWGVMRDSNLLVCGGIVLVLIGITAD